jgi:hypothetical protein
MFPVIGNLVYPSGQVLQYECGLYRAHLEIYPWMRFTRSMCPLGEARNLDIADSGGDIEASDLNDPLKSSNQGLIYLDASMSSRSDVSSSGWSPLAR